MMPVFTKCDMIILLHFSLYAVADIISIGRQRLKQWLFFGNKTILSAVGFLLKDPLVMQHKLLFDGRIELFNREEYCIPQRSIDTLVS